MKKLVRLVARRKETYALTPSLRPFLPVLHSFSGPDVHHGGPFPVFLCIPFQVYIIRMVVIAAFRWNVVSDKNMATFLAMCLWRLLPVGYIRVCCAGGVVHCAPDD